MAHATLMEYLPAMRSRGPELRFGNDLFSASCHHAGEEFAPYEAMLALDPQTVRLCLRVLIALSRNLPLLIEGEPATSKTSVATYAALLLGKQVVRVNMSTNTREELVLGGFQPDPEGELAFRWVDGPGTEALAQGRTLLLDEANLAKAGMLDRMLSITEQPPTLRLIERDGRMIPPHKDFRVVAVQNPEDHAGRRPMSPAWRDRLVPFHQPTPGVSEYRAALRHWTEGRASATVSPGTPDFAFDGTFALPRLPPKRRLCPALGKAKFLSEPLERLAMVVATIAEQCRTGLIGKDRSSSYRFGRRQLAAFMRDLDADMVEARRAGEADFRPRFLRAIQLHFLHAFAEGVDRDSVREVLVSERLLVTEPMALPSRPARGAR